MSDQTDLRGRFADYASGEISDDALRVLEAALRDDTDLRQDFIEYMNVDSALGDLAALSRAEIAEFDTTEPSCLVPVRRTSLSADLVPTDKDVRRTSKQQGRVIALMGTVAATLLVAAAMWTAKPVPELVAKVVTGVDATLKTSDQEEWDKSELSAGAYTLERGLLHLRFSDGVMVYIEAPARFDAVTNKRIVLHNGRLSASVPPEGIGFTIETSEAQIVDYGTEFSVEAESGASEVHVFDGLVRVHSRYGKNDEADAIDLRTSEAIRIEDSPQSSMRIKLAAERFIRNFEEPKRNYATSVKQLLPVAYYRMPIRDRGLVSEPPQYSGEVMTASALTDGGTRPPHARGMFAGGSLRVRADSTGRGGRVDSPPPLITGQFTLAVFVYAETRKQDGTVATNIRGDEGNFALSHDENGLLRATIRKSDGELQSVASDASLPLTTWRLVVMTADGEQLQLYEDGQLVASTKCTTMAACESETIWFGTGADGFGLWDGRIDELALFDRALSAKDIAALYQAAREETAKSE